MGPIYLNLSGDFTIPSEGERSPPIAGSVSGDLRLASLDAFLEALNSAEANCTENNATHSLVKYLAKCKAHCREDTVLQITSILDASANKLTHSFRVIPKSKLKEIELKK